MQRVEADESEIIRESRKQLHGIRNVDTDPLKRIQAPSHAPAQSPLAILAIGVPAKLLEDRLVTQWSPIFLSVLKWLTKSGSRTKSYVDRALDSDYHSGNH